MYYLFLGENLEAARRKRDEMLTLLQQKRPDSEFIQFSPDTWDPVTFESFIGAQGLFEKKCVISSSDLFEDDGRVERLLSFLKELQQSPNAFLFLERELSKSVESKLKKYAEKVFEFKEERVRKKNTFNVFSLADALGVRDRKRLWVLFQEAIREGVPAEQIHGTLWWQMKTLALVRESKSANEAGVGEFPWRNAQRFLKHYSPEDIARLSEDLVSLYHNSRRGVSDLDVALERFILNI